MKKKTSLKQQRSAGYDRVRDCLVQTFGHPSKPELSVGVRARCIEGGDCQAFSEALDVILPATFQDRQSLIDHFEHFDELVTFEFEDVIREAMIRLYGCPNVVRFTKASAHRFANPDQYGEEDYSPTGVLPPMCYAQTIGTLAKIFWLGFYYREAMDHRTND